MNSILILRHITFVLVSLYSLTAIGQGISQGHHNFSGKNWNGDEKCIQCHTPNNSESTKINSSLWSHKENKSGFELFSLASMDGIPSGKSKLCLSCHDGTVAVANHMGNNNGSVFGSFGTLKTKLSNEHPVSYLYTNGMDSLNTKLFDPATTMSGLGGTIEKDLLKNGRIECNSCHDVHLSQNIEGCNGCHKVNEMGVATLTVSLWKSNEHSALCLTCHK